MQMPAGRPALWKPLAVAAAAAGCLVLALVSLDVSRILGQQAVAVAHQRVALVEGAQGDSKTQDWDGMLDWSQKSVAAARLHAKAVRSFLAAKESPHHSRALTGSMANSSKLWVAPDVSKFNLTLPRCEGADIDDALLCCDVNESSGCCCAYSNVAAVFVRRCAVKRIRHILGRIRFLRGQASTLGRILCKTRRTCCFAPSSTALSKTAKIAF